jgi:hypothetical protein
MLLNAGDDIIFATADKLKAALLIKLTANYCKTCLNVLVNKIQIVLYRVKNVGKVKQSCPGLN